MAKRPAQRDLGRKDGHGGWARAEISSIWRATKAYFFAMGDRLRPLCEQDVFPQRAPRKLSVSVKPCFCSAKGVPAARPDRASWPPKTAKQGHARRCQA